ncbi:MAG: Ig-like domain-containing protein [Bacteroidales bacterium]|nr:Ig-like domain-containing protein [Bacteroidales bacterium]
MKKCIIILLSVVLFSCKKDKEEPIPVVSVAQANVNLYTGTTFQIVATGGDSLTYQSDNEFVAKVSKTGLINADRVGRANITVSSATSSATVYVKVDPKFNLYEEPLINWSLTKTEVIAQLGTPSEQDGGRIYYTSSNTAVYRYSYVFDNLNKLEASAVIIKSFHYESLSNFVAERYLFIGQSDGLFVFVNHIDPEKVNLSVVLGIVNADYLMVMYMPFSPTQVKGSNDYFKMQSEVFLESNIQ